MKRLRAGPCFCGSTPEAIFNQPDWYVGLFLHPQGKEIGDRRKIADGLRRTDFPGALWDVCPRIGGVRRDDVETYLRMVRRFDFVGTVNGLPKAELHVGLPAT